MRQREVLLALAALLLGALLLGGAAAAPKPETFPVAALPSSGMQKRWLFIWRDMSDPKEVDRMTPPFPPAQADGYTGAAFSYNTPASKAAELRAAAKQHGLDLVAIVMGGTRDR